MLVVAARETDGGMPGRLGRRALDFTLAAQSADGRTHNRMSSDGDWTDDPSTDDCWGRSLWAFGVAATHHEDPSIRAVAAKAFDRGARQRSRWPRAMAFAALGAADIAATGPTHGLARGVLYDAARAIGASASAEWMWPEDRLTYASAVLAEATIAAGAALGDGTLLDRGLGMLGWLLDRQTRGGHLSFTGTSGADASTQHPQFDQQPIEASSFADACWRAYTLTSGARWADGVRLAAAWFHGTNDTGAVMHDPASGGAYDGLTPTGVNINQGAESTLAFISTVQRVRSMSRAAP
jgi:hypothetical protein